MTPTQALGIATLVYFLPTVWWSMAVTHWPAPRTNSSGEIEVLPNGIPVLKQMFLEVTVMESVARRYPVRMLAAAVVSIAFKLILG